MDTLKLSDTLINKITSDKDFINLINDLMTHPKVIEMGHYRHHGHIDCLSHSVHVSYFAYKLGLKLHLNTKALARGGFLHDFYLYDWHIKGDRKGFHGFTHPNVAFKNASKYFNLTSIEEDIIKSHMWPMTLKLPKYKESFLVMLVDKYCATIELLP